MQVGAVPRRHFLRSVSGGALGLGLFGAGPLLFLPRKSRGVIVIAGHHFFDDCDRDHQRLERLLGNPERESERPYVHLLRWSPQYFVG